MVCCSWALSPRSRASSCGRRCGNLLGSYEAARGAVPVPREVGTAGLPEFGDADDEL